MMKTILASVAFASLLSLVGCAAPTETENDTDVAVAVDTSSTSEQASFIDTYAAQEGLTLATSIPLCDGSADIKVSKGAMFDIFGGDSAQQNCMPRTYDRGVGVPMVCAPGLIQSGAICYRPCKAGYKMVAGVCWQDSCPDGFRDDGAFCAKPAAYGRGAGYALWQESKCEARHPGGCEKYGLMWYPKCKEGYDNIGSNICSPTCPDGMTDIGVSCQKKTYVQNSSNTTPISYSPWPRLDTPIFTAPLNTCPSDHPSRSGEVCYKDCVEGYKGTNTLCTYSGN